MVFRGSKGAWGGGGFFASNLTANENGEIIRL